MDAVAFVTFASVAPINRKNAPIRSAAEVQSAKPLVSREKKILTVVSYIARALTFQKLLIRTESMHIECKKPVVKCSWPVVPLINKRSDVGVAASKCICRPVAGFGPVLGSVEVKMISVLVDERINVGIRIHSAGSHVMSAGDTVPEVAVDCVDEKQLAVFVPVMSPGIGGAGIERFKNFALWMVAPHTAAQRDAFGLWGARCADVAGSSPSAAPIEPAVGSPAQTIGKIVVALRWNCEPVQNDLRSARRLFGLRG